MGEREIVEPVWELTLPKLTPPSALLPNNRLRRSGNIVGRKVARIYRKDVETVASAARNRAGLDAPLFPGPVRVKVLVAWEKSWMHGKKISRFQYRKHPDPDGLDSALKGLWDGLQDAGILGNDKYLIREPVEQTNDPNEDGYVAIQFYAEAA